MAGKGSEESCRCGIGRGEFKQGPRNGETEAGKYGFGSALCELIHKNGYTPKATAVSVRGDLANANGRLQLKVSGTSETLALAADPKNPAAYCEAPKKLGQTVVIQGVMVPSKELKASVPLQIGHVK